eukprot:g7734.t1
MIIPSRLNIATGESLILCVIVCWTLTVIFRYDVIESNPLKDVTGYNNVCVGFDVYPARIVAVPFMVAISYFSATRARLDSLRADLEYEIGDINIAQYKCTIYANNIYTCILFCVPGFLVVSPEDNVAAHTGIFCLLIIGRFIASLADYYEAPKKTTCDRISFYCVLLTSFFLPFFLLLDFINYDFERGGKQEPYINSWLLMIVDYGWFASTAFGTKADAKVFSGEYQLSVVGKSKLANYNRKNKLLSVNEDNYDEEKLDIAKQIPCPVLGTLYAYGILPYKELKYDNTDNDVDDDATTGTEKDSSNSPELILTLQDCYEACAMVGIPQKVADMLVWGIKGNITKSLDLPNNIEDDDPRLYFNILNHVKYGMSHNINTGMNNINSQQAYYDFIENLEVVNGEKRLYSRDLYDWEKNEKKKMKLGNKNNNGSVPGGMVIASFIEVFGRIDEKNEKNGFTKNDESELDEILEQELEEEGTFDSYITAEDIRRMWLERKYPKGWKPRLHSLAEIRREILQYMAGSHVDDLGGGILALLCLKCGCKPHNKKILRKSIRRSNKSLTIKNVEETTSTVIDNNDVGVEFAKM